jgi:hypothetical protein
MLDRKGSGLRSPLRHIGRNFVAYLALFFALGGTSLAAGKLLTGADIQDDSLYGADIVEPSLAKVPSAGNADQLGGKPASAFQQTGAAAGGALEGTYPSPDIATDAVTTKQIKNQTVGRLDLADGAVWAANLFSGAAAGNIWGSGQWAPSSATQRGYAYVSALNVQLNQWDHSLAFISYPVPLHPGDVVQSHVIPDGSAAPEGCGVTYNGFGLLDELTADPGNLCIFYDPNPNDALVVDISSPGYGRYGALLRADTADVNADYGCRCSVSADVVWAMTPPNRRIDP